MSSPLPPPWVVAVHTPSASGSGVIVSEHAIVTCTHVVNSAVRDGEITVEGEGIRVPIVRSVRCIDRDLAILYMTHAWQAAATLLVGVTSRAELAPDSELVSFGFGTDRVGSTLAYTRFAGEDFRQSGQSHGRGDTEHEDLFRAAGLMRPGMSGGALAITSHAARPVLGVNKAGGDLAPYGTFISSDAVVAFLLRERVGPLQMLEWHELLGRGEIELPAHRIDRWQRRLGLSSASVRLGLRVGGQSFRESFRLVPPARGIGHGPLWVQETVVDAAMLGSSALNAAARGTSPRNARAFAAAVAAHYRIPCRLMTAVEWHDVATAGGTQPLPFIAPRAPLAPGMLSRNQLPNAYGVRRAASGTYEMTVEAVGPARAFSGQSHRDGTPDWIEIPEDVSDPASVFRLAIPAHAALDALGPLWNEEPCER